MEEAERPEATRDGEKPEPSAEDSGLSAEEVSQSTDRTPQRSDQPPTPDPGQEVERLRSEMEGIQTRWLESHRRALLAENAGKVVPELVAGSTVEELERSVETARAAFEAARSAALAEMASTQVPAGNPVRQGASLETMSPMEKIAYGLTRE